MAGQPDYISHWGHLFENFQTPSLGFYRSVEAAVQARSVPETHWTQVEHKEAGLGSANRAYMRIHRGKYAFDICAAPFGTGFSFSWWFTEPPLKFALLYTLGFFFALLIALNVAFAIGAAMGAVMGLGSFLGGSCGALIGVPAILWLLGNAVRQGSIRGESTVLAVPIVGWIYERVFSPATYYAIDTALMFQDAVHNAVMEVIDCVTQDKGVRALTESERKPIMKRFGPSLER
jgi:hypothetical protein